MASPIERNASADVAARQSIMPAIPHIATHPILRMSDAWATSQINRVHRRIRQAILAG
jgi:hypothetical protein